MTLENKELLPFNEADSSQNEIKDFIGQTSGIYFDFVQLEDIFSKEDERFSDLTNFLRTLSVSLN